MTFDNQAKRIERRVNERLAEIGMHAHVASVAAELVPEGWEWAETTTIGQPPTITITGYVPPELR